MAVVIEQLFPLGRFHATRWKQNPFEDRYGEWPPSPWRLLRALLARWFQYVRETGDDDPEKRDALLRALASELPAFQLPAATWRGQNLRQYQPTAVKFTKKRDVPEVKKSQPTLAIDHYRVVCDQEHVIWVWQQLALYDEQRMLLADLLRRIHYFGRAESFTAMQLTAKSSEPNCVLRTDSSMTSNPVLAHSPDQPLDIDLMLAATDDKRIAKRPHPPGAAWYQAELPPVPRRKPLRRRITSPSKPQVVRVALDSTVLPLVTETLPVAEAARRSLMSWHGRLTERNGVRGRSDTLSGKDVDGNPLQNHSHAYYLPTDEDNDRRIDHLTLIARDGFGSDEMRAIDRLREITPRGRDNASHPLRVLMLGYGRLEEYKPCLLKSSRIWKSSTPYIATQYAKTRGRHRVDMRNLEARTEFLISNLRTQLQTMFPHLDVDDVRISPQFDRQAFKVATRWRPIQFKRFRSKRSDDGGRRLAGAFRIEFQEEVPGPIVLGHSSHFGMGLFMPRRPG